MSRAVLLGLGLLLLVLASLAFWVYRSGQAPGTGRLQAEPDPSAGPFYFTDVSSDAGVDFGYFRGETGEYWITETTGGGAALVDYDADGWLDILVVDGCRQPPDPVDRQHTSRLFRNQHDGTFAELTGAADVAHAGYGQGCVALDYDNDGFDDLYLTCWGPNALYRNNGDGTFQWQPQPESQAESPWSTGAVPGDFDRDGNVDLLVVRYLEFNYRDQPVCGDPRTGKKSYCGPNSFAAAPSLMLRNCGDGWFEDVSRSWGIVLPDGSARPHAKGLGAVAADFNDDGWLDVYVANDLEPNFLFRNRGDSNPELPRFEEVGLARGVATSVDGAAQDSMGVACGDYNGDGRLDLLVTNYYLEGVTLYRNLGNAGFADATRTAGLLGPTRSVLGWGTGLFDFDNDGWLDLFTANGHVQPEPDPGASYAMPAQLFRNVAGSRFEEVSRFAGDYFQRTWNGRGAAFGDLDNDGDTDIVVVHHHQPVAILRNDSRSQNHWIRLALVGRSSDRHVIGGRIKVSVAHVQAEANGLKSADGPAPPVLASLVREVSSAGSYISSNDRRALIGLSHNTSVRTIELHWPSGKIQVLNVVGSDREFVVHEP